MTKVIEIFGQSLGSMQSIILEGKEKFIYVDEHLQSNGSYKYFIQDDEGDDHEILRVINNRFVFKKGNINDK